VLGEGAAVPLFSNKNGLFLPRVGIAYRLNKWVLRAGSGWFDNSAHFNVYTILNLTPPYSAGQQFSAITTSASSNTRVFTPGSFVLEMGPDLFNGPTKTKPLNLYAVDPNRQNDTHWQWSADIQRALPLGTALTIGYVGSKTTNASSIMSYWNSAQPSPNTDFQSRRPYGYFYDPLASHPIQQAGTIQRIIGGLNNHYEGLTVSPTSAIRTGWRSGSITLIVWRTDRAPVLRIIPTDKTQTTWPMDEAGSLSTRGTEQWLISLRIAGTAATEKGLLGACWEWMAGKRDCQ
jgi:hypothetical protein